MFLNTFFEGSTTGRFTVIKDAFNQVQLFEKAKLYCFSLRKGPVSDPKTIIPEPDLPTSVQTRHIPKRSKSCTDMTE